VSIDRPKEGKVTLQAGRSAERPVIVQIICVRSIMQVFSRKGAEYGRHYYYY